MRRVRVMWLLKGLGPGGAEQLLVSAARVADHERFSYSTAYLLPWKDHLVPQLQQHGVHVDCLDAPQVLDPRWAWRLRALLLAQQVDVLHLHSPLVAGVARAVVRTLPSSVRPAVVSTEHNAWWSYAWPTRRLNALQHRTDAARFAVSQDVLDTIWPSHREGVEVLVHGLVLDDVDAVQSERGAVRAGLGLDDDAVVVLTVANLRAQKGYPDLLAAASEVLAADPRVVFLAVGQGPLAEDVARRHAELQLGDRFRLLGYREDVPRLLAASDVFTLASLHEGFPVALMEALAAGVPVVVTDVGGIPDAVGDGVEGFVVPPSRPDLLADRLLRLVRDPALRAQCSVAAQAAGRRFDITTAVRRLEQVYADVAPRRDA